MNGWKTILVGDLAYFQALEHIKEGISLEGAGGKKTNVSTGSWWLSLSKQTFLGSSH